MIEPMIRYSLVLYHGDVKPFMERLRELGVVDITFSEWEASPEQRERIGLSERYANAYRHLGSVKANAAEADTAAGDLAPYATVREAVEAYEAAAERIAQLETLRAKATTELDELAMWGEIFRDRAAGGGECCAGAGRFGECCRRIAGAGDDVRAEGTTDRGVSPSGS